MHHIFENLNRDVRYALRQIARSPFFTLACAVSMGMGIAVTVTAFTLMRSFLYKPLPVPDRGSIVHVNAAMQIDSFGFSSYRSVEDYAKQGAFSGLVAYGFGYGTLEVRKRVPERYSFEYVSPNYFDVLRLKLRSGRGFTASGDRPEIVISDSYRRHAFKSGDQVLGATVRINRNVLTVVGVAPKSFRGLDDNSVAGWVPAQMRAVIDPKRAGLTDATDRAWRVSGRLAPGVGTVEAAARLQPVAQEYAKLYQDWRDIRSPMRMKVFTHDQRAWIYIREGLGEALLMLVCVLAVVLSLACTNVAGLLLARSVTRRHEVAVRLTLGATRRRLATQFLTESVLLSLIGGAVGWLLAYWLMSFAMRSPMFNGIELHPDIVVLGATVLTCFVCAVLFGATPIAHTLRVDVKGGLSGGGAVGERGGVRGRLMALQVCLSCLLIVLGLHASRGIVANIASRVGFDVNGLLVAQLQPWGVPSIRDSVDRKAYVESAEQIFRSAPGVVMTTPSYGLEAVDGMASGRAYVRVPGADPVQVYTATVRVDYFRTLGVGMKRGQLPRTFAAGTQRTGVVNRAFIDSIGHDVVGTTITLADNGDVYIAAEANSIRTVGPAYDWPLLYELAPEGAYNLGYNYIVARVRPGSENEAIAHFSRAMRSRYPEVVPPSLSTMKANIDVYTAPQRYVARAALILGGAELVLAAIGLYSLLLYAMLTRTRELGIRMALGAAPRRAGFAIMRDGMTYIGVGLVLGVVISIPASIIAANNFPGARVEDVVPLTFAVVSITVAALLAGIVPMRRAARVQPIEALRHE